MAKAVEIPPFLVIGVIALVLLAPFLLHYLGQAKDLFEKMFGLGDSGKCTNQEFWCGSGGKGGKGECMQWGTIGKEGEVCNPKSYKGVNIKPGEYDICDEGCKVHFCAAGTGRVGSKCISGCKNVGEDCGGGVPITGWLGAGNCCADELVDCKGSFIGIGHGTCTAKAGVKK